MTGTRQLTVPVRPVPADSRGAERMITTATFLTGLGNNIHAVAAAFLLMRTMGAAMAVGWLFIAIAAPQAVLSAPFGRLADRLDRRGLCLVCDLASAGVALCLPLWLWSGGPTGTAVYVTSLALAVAGAAFVPASGALVKERVDAGRLRPFSARYEAAMNAGQLLSTAVGGFAVAAFGPQPLFAFNALTFVASAGCWAAMGRRVRPAPYEDRPGPAPEAVLVRGPRVWRLVALHALGNVIIVTSNVGIVVLVVDYFRRGAGTLGVIDSLAGAGMLLASLAYRRLHGGYGDLRVIAYAYPVLAVTMICQPHFGIPGGLTTYLIGGFTFGLTRIAGRSMLLSAIDPARAGRTLGAANAIGLAASALVTSAFSWACDALSVPAAFLLLAAITAAVAGPAMAGLRRQQRRQQKRA